MPNYVCLWAAHIEIQIQDNLEPAHRASFPLLPDRKKSEARVCQEFKMFSGLLSLHLVVMLMMVVVARADLSSPYPPLNTNTETTTQTRDGHLITIPQERHIWKRPAITTSSPTTAQEWPTLPCFRKKSTELQAFYNWHWKVCFWWQICMTINHLSQRWPWCPGQTQKVQFWHLYQVTWSHKLKAIGPSPTCCLE